MAAGLDTCSVAFGRTRVSKVTGRCATLPTSMWANPRLIRVAVLRVLPRRAIRGHYK